MIQARREIYHIPGEGYARNRVTPRTRKVKKVIRKRSRLPGKLVGAVTGAFVVGILVVYVCAQVAAFGYRIVELKKDIADLERSNKRLELSIARLSSLDRVQRIAESELGMCKPSEMQMLAMVEDTQNVPVINIRAEQRPLQAEKRPLEEIYRVIAKLVGRSSVVGMNQ